MRKIIFICTLLLSTSYIAQAQKTDNSAGELQIGVRSTFSLFGTDGYAGMGVGGQFRIRLGDRLNTEWFADYITSDMDGLGQRADSHIGWSVMFYPLPNASAKIRPYILAGHCFDHTKVTIFGENANETQRRLSSAVQVGLGTHFQLSDKFDLSLSAQYMTHLGNDIHVESEIINDEKYLTFHDEEGSALGLEGHLFLTLSVNYKLADLW